MFKKICLLPLLPTLLFAQTEQGAEHPAGGNFTQTLIMVGVAILFFYFILWRPEQKRRKTLENQRSNMKRGDRITAMGIVGTLVRVSADNPTVIVKMFDGSKIEMLKAAITEVHPATEEEAKKFEKEEPASQV